MRLQEAVEIGLECGLRTYGEALRNIHIHAPSLFTYEEADREITELEQEFVESGYAVQSPLG